MSEAFCALAGDVQSFYDGRSAAGERAAFEEHLAGCSTCKAELARLRSTTLALRKLPAQPVDEVSLRRRRQHVLLDARSRPARSRRRRVMGALAAAIVSAGLAGGFALWRGPVREAPPASVTIVASDAARWSRRLDGAIERVEVVEGELSFDVRRTGDGRRLVVAVPDGVIEDIGTRFVVDVRAGRVQRIEVSEGAVVFHRSAGLGAVSIVAPATWRAAEAPIALGSTSASAAHEAPAATPTVPTASAAPLAPPPLAVRQAGSAPATTSAPELGDALALIRSGQSAAAAAKLRTFLALHPTAPNVEDAAYLLVVASTRSAARAEAREAARAYLARFPNGFRRHEVELILRD
jgi:hypothetical protein